MFFNVNGTNFSSWCGSGTTYNIANLTIGNINTVNATFKKTQGRTIIVNGTTYNNDTIANNATNNSDNFALFGDIATGGSLAYIKLYYFKIINVITNIISYVYIK